MIILTEQAGTAVKAAMSRAGKLDAGLRVMVEAGAVPVTSI